MLYSFETGVSRFSISYICHSHVGQNHTITAATISIDRRAPRGMGGPDEFLTGYLNHILHHLFLISVRQEMRTLDFPTCWSHVTLPLSASFSTAFRAPG